MAPPLVTRTIEVEFVPGSGTWVDISDRCEGLTIARPRADPATGASVTTMTATLQNHPWEGVAPGVGFCPFTPDNPGGRWYPNVARDRRVRVTAISSAISYVRFLGFVDKWEPEMSGGGVGQSTVTLSASCVLSRYARRTVLSYYGESVLTQTNIDYYPFDDPADSMTVRGFSGDPIAFPAREGIVVPPSVNPGSLTFSAPDGGHLMDGQAEFTRGDSVSAPAPVILLTLRAGVAVAAVSASFRLSSDPAGSTGDEALAGYDIAGALLWMWSATLTAGKVVWQLRDASGAARSFWDTTAARDDGWHNWQIQFLTATQSQIVLVEKGGFKRVLGSFAWTNDPRPTAFIIVGGQMVPQRRGKQANTLQGSVSSLTVNYSGTVFDWSEFAVPGVPSDADRVTTFLGLQGAALNALTGTPVTPGADARQVAYTNKTSDLLSRWNEHTITVGGHLSTDPIGRRRYLTAEDCRPIAVALTLDAVDDLDIPSGGWQAVKDEQPTRVTGEGPVGSIIAIDDETEAATGLQLDGPTIQTSAGTLALARSAAGRLMITKLARLSQFGVNLTLTGTDKVAAMMAVRQTDRIRVTGLPTEYLGLTYQDVYASGWTESYPAPSGAVFVFDTDTADDPPEGRLDDSEYGRISMGDGAATVTGGTCVGITGTGTLIVTSTSPLTTTAGDYPMGLNWNGEQVTVSAPGGATSPQTFPVTARGVGPTVARVHASGEAVDVWHGATVAL